MHHFSAGWRIHTSLNKIIYITHIKILYMEYNKTYTYEKEKKISKLYKKWSHKFYLFS